MSDYWDLSSTVSGSDMLLKFAILQSYISLFDHACSLCEDIHDMDLKKRKKNEELEYDFFSPAFPSLQQNKNIFFVFLTYHIT